MSERRIRVIRIISTLAIGGVQSMLLNTLPYFDRERFELRVICTDRNGKLARILREQGVPVELVKVNGRLNPFHVWRLARRLRALRPDIVHTHMYASNITGVAAAHWARVPVILSHIHSAHEWRGAARIWIERVLHPLRSGYIAVSRHAEQAFLEKTGLPCGEMFRVMPNAVRPLGTETDTSVDLREKLNIPAGVPVIGSVTRLVPVKGLPTMLRALKRVIQEEPEVRLVLVGRGAEHERLEQLARRLGILRNVVFVGESRNVARYYRLFDIFALSSLSEGCPNVLLEAMRLGKPIVATRVGGVPEVVEDGRTGLLVEARQPEALGAALLRLLHEPGLRERLADAAREEGNQYTRKVYVDRMQSYYEEMLARKNVPIR